MMAKGAVGWGWGDRPVPRKPEGETGHKIQEGCRDGCEEILDTLELSRQLTTLPASVHSTREWTTVCRGQVTCRSTCPSWEGGLQKWKRTWNFLHTDSTRLLAWRRSHRQPLLPQTLPGDPSQATG